MCVFLLHQDISCPINQSIPSPLHPVKHVTCAIACMLPFYHCWRRSQQMLRNAATPDDCWWWTDFIVKSIDAASCSTDIVSLSLIVGSFCYWSPSDIGCQLDVRTAAQVSWGILWLAPEGSHITGVRDCSVENVSRKRNMNWKNRSITSWRRNKLGFFFFFYSRYRSFRQSSVFAVEVRFFFFKFLPAWRTAADLSE